MGGEKDELVKRAAAYLLTGLLGITTGVAGTTFGGSSAEMAVTQLHVDTLLREVKEIKADLKDIEIMVRALDRTLEKTQPSP